MNSKFENRLSLAAISMTIVLGLGLSNFAHAHIPPAWFQIKSISNNRTTYKTLTIRSTVTDGSQSVSLLTVVDTKEQRLETYVLDAQGKELYGVARSFAEPIAFSESAPNVVLLFENRFDFMIRGLRAAGIPVILPNDKDPANAEPSQLLRLNGKVSYLFGMEGKLQVLIEKDSFIPLQVRKPNGTQIDYSNYKMFRFVSFPRQIRVHQAEQTLLTEEIREVLIDGPAIAHTVVPDAASIPSDGVAKAVFQWLR